MIRFVYWCGVLRGRLKTLLNPRVTKQGQLRCGKSVKFDTNCSSGLIRFEGTAFWMTILVSDSGGMGCLQSVVGLHLIVSTALIVQRKLG